MCFVLKGFPGPRLEWTCGSKQPLVVQQLHHRRGRHLRQLGQQQTPGESTRHPHVSNKTQALQTIYRHYLICLFWCFLSYYFCIIVFHSFGLFCSVWPSWPWDIFKTIRPEFNLGVSEHLSSCSRDQCIPTCSEVLPLTLTSDLPAERGENLPTGINKVQLYRQILTLVAQNRRDSVNDLCLFLFSNRRNKNYKSKPVLPKVQHRIYLYFIDL